MIVGLGNRDRGHFKMVTMGPISVNFKRTKSNNRLRQHDYDTTRLVIISGIKEFYAKQFSVFHEWFQPLAHMWVRKCIYMYMCPEQNSISTPRVKSATTQDVLCDALGNFLICQRVIPETQCDHLASCNRLGIQLTWRQGLKFEVKYMIWIFDMNIS